MTGLIGLGDNWRRNLVLGLLAGLAFAFLVSIRAGFSIGVPRLPLSAGSTINNFVIVLAAPIIEEIFFGIIVFLFFEKLLLFTGRANGILSAMLTALVFAGFHFAAFRRGDYVAGGTPFLGAFIFRLVAQGLISTYGVASSMVTHSIINLTILLRGVLT